jgi:hypothetical protein
MRCEHCGCVFCDDEAAERASAGVAPKRFCSERCATHARHKRTRPGRRRAQTCAAKRRYETLSDALTVLRWIREEGKGRPDDRAYRCAVCDGWHLTSSHREFQPAFAVSG